MFKEARGGRFLEAGVTGDCETLDLGAGNGTQVLEE